MQLKLIHYDTFRSHAQRYIEPAIVHSWKTAQDGMLQQLSQEQNIVLGGDLRADSPGHSAKYGSYSVMDLRTSSITDVQLVQSNEVGGSNNMAKEGLKRSLDLLRGHGVTFDSIVTDRHPQVHKFLREANITQYFDVWHIEKDNVDKLLELTFEKVLVDPTPFVDDILKISIPEDLSAQFHKPDKLVGVESRQIGSGIVFSGSMWTLIFTALFPSVILSYEVDTKKLNGLARARVEVKAFVTQDIPLYHNLVMKHIPGADPELVLVNHYYEELDRIPLSEMTRTEINALLAKLGFYKKENPEDQVPEEFRFAPAKDSPFEGQSTGPPPKTDTDQSKADSQHTDL
ncbi:seleno M-like protein [Labeo rohita]|uniref:Seleno M-like protein n=1 Tax=Labeo rohita TaxID=84645 RepID=A0A498NBN8_LABRO|nr:seleno M-like protein [Labeo rohita]